MAIRLKANVGYTPVIEEVNRKFVPRKETCSAAGNAGPVKLEGSGWMGGACRNTYRGVLGACKRNYLVVRKNARTSLPSSKELQARLNFKTVSMAVPEILQDLSQLTDIQLLWQAASADASKKLNDISAKGYTFKGWIFAVQYAGLAEDPQYDVTQFPTEFDA